MVLLAVVNDGKWWFTNVSFLISVLEKWIKWFGWFGWNSLQYLPGAIFNVISIKPISMKCSNYLLKEVSIIIYDSYYRDLSISEHCLNDMQMIEYRNITCTLLSTVKVARIVW